MAAGCGKSKPARTTAIAIRTATPTAAADCLNSDTFLVNAEGRAVVGSSPGGVNLVVRFYKSVAAANVALARLDPAYARAIGTSVVDYAGNPPLHPGAPPMALTNDELATLRLCIAPRHPG